MAPATFVRINDADKGIGTATVDCPKLRVRVPLLVCQTCDSCAHASRPQDPKAWAVVCMFPA